MALAGAGSSSALVAAVAAAGCSVACGAASPTVATGSAVLCSATWSGLTSDAALNNETTFKQCQKQQQKTERRSTKVKHLQVRSPVCCGEPPPGPTGWRLRSHLYDAWCRRVAGHRISGGRRCVRSTARSPDQRRRGLLLLVVVIGDPDESTALWCLTALRRQRLCGGGVCCHRPFPHHPVLGGRGGVGLLLLTAGVPGTPSSVVLWRIFPRGILHPRCQ